jgi:hypothetical protein
MDIEKQKLECEITEMLEVIEKAREIYANDITDHTENEYICEGLLDAGYRKQNEGEWIWDREHANYKCSLCGEYDFGVPKFCRGCGAKMKGGAEQ